MNDNDLESCFMVVATVCSYDGVITNREKNKITEVFSKNFKNFNEDKCISLLDLFFASFDDIETYVSRVLSNEAKEFVVLASQECAAADGLDLRENIALDKVKMLLNNN